MTDLAHAEIGALLDAEFRDRSVDIMLPAIMERDRMLDAEPCAGCDHRRDMHDRLVGHRHCMTELAAGCACDGFAA